MLAKAGLQLPTASYADCAAPRFDSSSSSSVLWLDFHVHKNAGTSVREAMHALQRRLPARAVYFDRMQSIKLRSLQAWRASSNCSGFAAVEFHEHRWVFLPSLLPWVRSLRLRAASSGACCNCTRPFLTTRVREPLEWYLSLYTWAAIATRPWGGKPVSRECRASPVPAAAADGCSVSFLEWVRRAQPRIIAGRLLA